MVTIDFLMSRIEKPWVVVGGSWRGGGDDFTGSWQGCFFCAGRGDPCACASGRWRVRFEKDEYNFTPRVLRVEWRLSCEYELILGREMPWVVPRACVCFGWQALVGFFFFVCEGLLYGGKCNVGFSVS